MGCLRVGVEFGHCFKAVDAVDNLSVCVVVDGLSHCHGFLGSALTLHTAFVEHVECLAVVWEHLVRHEHVHRVLKLAHLLGSVAVVLAEVLQVVLVFAIGAFTRGYLCGYGSSIA